jgi:hypothetical protein
MDDTIREISNQLSRIFRHMFPGLFIVSAAYLAHRKWFCSLALERTWEAMLLALITLAVGNIWYVIHRYIVHQFVDYLLYVKRGRGREKCGCQWRGYPFWLAEFIYESFHYKQREGELGRHLHLRSAEIILIYIVGEVLVVFSFWNEQTSFFACNEWLRYIGFGLIVAAFIQHCLGDYLDRGIVERIKGSGDQPPHSRR